MSQEVDDFLAHFGKKGMKWGHRSSGATYSKQQMVRRNASAERGQHILDANKGSAAHFAGQAVVKNLLVGLASTVGANLVSQIAPKPIAVGAQVVATGVNMAYTVSQIRQAVDVSRAVNKANNS